VNPNYGWSESSFRAGESAARREAREALAATLNRLRTTTTAQHNTAYQQALDDVADANGIRSETKVTYRA
jgi:hypothetical protein